MKTILKICDEQVMLRGKFLALSAYIRKVGKNLNDLNFHWKEKKR